MVNEMVFQVWCLWDAASAGSVLVSDCLSQTYMTNDMHFCMKSTGVVHLRRCAASAGGRTLKPSFALLRAY